METGRPTWRSRVWLGATGVLVILAALFSSVGFSSATAGWVAVAIAAALACSVVVIARSRVNEQRARHEDALATWAGERAAQDERLRIASELHDLVSHGLGLITIRASAALSVPGAEGERERVEALADIETAGSETMTELRRMLTVLREPASAPLRPADALSDLPEIAAAAAKTGLKVTLDVEMEGEVSCGVQVAVCAMVREALSNAARHAGPTAAHVAVRGDKGAVTVVVTDEGRCEGWRPQPGAGHGLGALRYRVARLGGTLEAGPGDTGFRVSARIPDGVLA